MLKRMIAIALWLGAVGCGSSADTVTSPTTPDSGVPAASSEATNRPADATTNSDNTVEFHQFNVFISCIPETVQASGQLHVVVHSTVNDTGTHVTAHVNSQNASGVGDVTGDRYQLVQIQQIDQEIHTGEETSQVLKFRLIGQGPGKNSVLHATLDLTGNANGGPTASFSNSTSDCT